MSFQDFASDGRGPVGSGGVGKSAPTAAAAPDPYSRLCSTIRAELVEYRRHTGAIMRCKDDLGTRRDSKNMRERMCAPRAAGRAECCCVPFSPRFAPGTITSPRLRRSQSHFRRASKHCEAPPRRPGCRTQRGCIQSCPPPCSVAVWLTPTGPAARPPRRRGRADGAREGGDRGVARRRRGDAAARTAVPGGRRGRCCEQVCSTFHPWLLHAALTRCRPPQVPLVIHRRRGGPAARAVRCAARLPPTPLLGRSRWNWDLLYLVVFFGGAGRGPPPAVPQPLPVPHAERSRTWRKNLPSTPP